MIIKLPFRFLTSIDLRLLWKLSYNFGWKGMLAVNKFNKRCKNEENPFPAFIVMSITNNCNLKCQGCWITQTNPPIELELDQVENVIRACKKRGSFFFGILGGEPLLYPQLFEIFERHPDAYFQLFTNGTIISDDVARKLRRLGNVTPLISIEGKEVVSDERRGGSDVYQRSFDGLRRCVGNRIFTGVATSVCKSNIDDLVSMDFVNEIIQKGAHYLWYYIYRPVGEDPNPKLALSEEDILRLRRFIVDLRTKVPLIIVDAYWDKDGNALCPAAVGISHHIGPAGDVEFCPPLQFATDNINNNTIDEILEKDGFISHFREFAASETRGCVILEKPSEMKQFLEREKAKDTTGRERGYSELDAMNVCPGHHIVGKEIPEKSWIYRFAKKYWFFGFGAYG